MGRVANFVHWLLGPSGQWVFVLIVSRKPARDDFALSTDLLGSLPYRKVAVYSSLEKAIHDAAWEAVSEYWDLKGFPRGGFATKEENDAWVPLREAEKNKGEASKEAMLKPHSWRQYESTDGKYVWFHEGPTLLDYRIIMNRVDRWAELPSDTPEWVRREFG